MMKTRAIVLKRSAFKERDSLVVLYTLDYGRMHIVAKGTQLMKSKLAAHLEPCSLIDLMILKNKYSISIGSAISRNSFAQLKEDYNALYLMGLSFNFLLKHIKEEEKDFELFFFLNSFLHQINDQAANISILKQERIDELVSMFKYKIVSLLGYSVDLESCNFCHQDASDFVFDFNTSSLLCLKCLEKNRKTLLLRDYFRLQKRDIVSLNQIGNGNIVDWLNMKYNKNLVKFIDKQIEYIDF